VFVNFFGWFHDGPDVYLAMEYVPFGDLEMNLQAGELSEAESKEISGQILLGLNIMHSEKFAHRDLKPQVSNYHKHFPRTYILLRSSRMYSSSQGHPRLSGGSSLRTSG
jgi:serine/threonine protein kinase